MNTDALVERYAKAIYETYVPAGREVGTVTHTNSPTWANAGSYERLFAITHARLVLQHMGLIQ